MIVFCKTNWEYNMPQLFLKLNKQRDRKPDVRWLDVSSDSSYIRQNCVNLLLHAQIKVKSDKENIES